MEGNMAIQAALQNSSSAGAHGFSKKRKSLAFMTQKYRDVQETQVIVNRNGDMITQKSIN